MLSWGGYLAGLGLAGWLTDSDTDDDALPWYLSGALTFLFIIAGLTLAVAALTKVGFIGVIGDAFRSYLNFVTGIVQAIAEPVIKLVL